MGDCTGNCTGDCIGDCTGDHTLVIVRVIVHWRSYGIASSDSLEGSPIVSMYSHKVHYLRTLRKNTLRMLHTLRKNRVMFPFKFPTLPRMTLI